VLDAVHHGIKREMAKKLKAANHGFALNSAGFNGLSLNGETKNFQARTPITELSEANTPEAVTPGI
jgi:hypothetical protein